ncbi:hypothetical protein ACGFZB_28880 [Streptomyces cinerochromogenes]|uniref:Uncharacterized protein n=1 Tax=Streptomyces cinerochromogenes TaxID=66422 RepID=A0ABW7BB69_9ACTN
MNARPIRDTVIFGKSYTWWRVSGRLELRPDVEARFLFSHSERRQWEAWRRTRQFPES